MHWTVPNVHLVSLSGLFFGMTAGALGMGCFVVINIVIVIFGMSIIIVIIKICLPLGALLWHDSQRAGYACFIVIISVFISIIVIIMMMMGMIMIPDYGYGYDYDYDYDYDYYNDYTSSSQSSALV